jgi:hypothetical protein
MRDYITKTRAFYNPRIIQLVNEVKSAQILRQALPNQVEDYQLVIPDTTMKIRANGVSVYSERLTGESLSDCIYNEELQGEALRIGVLVLSAIHHTQAIWRVGKWIGRIYQPVRSIKALRLIKLQTTHLPEIQENRLRDLLRKRYCGKARQVVHGDLHAGNILVDHANQRLGIIDLEVAHIGSSAVDFSALWSSYYLANPALGEQFFRAARQVISALEMKIYLEAVYISLVRNTFLLIHKGRAKKNFELEKRSFALLKRLLEMEDIERFFLGEERSDAN